MSYTGRFAPSPTGPLHYGSVVAALASFLDARQAGGRWLLRIEDLDPPRESKTAPAEIMSQLQALGLRWDGNVLYQHSRLEAYDACIRALDGHTFPCTCSRKSTPAVYPGVCRERTFRQTDGPRSIRLRVPDISVETDDRALGRVAWRLDEEVGDFIIMRKDGLHAYQLAVVVDDIHQSVTHIVRGQDLLESTPRQLALYHLLGVAPPSYLHIPIIVDGRGDKLSKQAHARPVAVSEPMQVLRAALASLGQPEQESATTPAALLARAAADWDTGRLPTTPTMPAPADIAGG